MLIASREGTPDPIQKAFAPQESARPARHERQIRLEIGEKRIKLLPVCRLLGNDADRHAFGSRRVLTAVPPFRSSRQEMESE